MRLLGPLAMWLVLGLVGGVTCSAEGPLQGVPGAAVFVSLAGDADDARSDVYEQPVAGGSARVLISHSALPKSFRGRIESALPSPDGALMLLEESHGVVIRNKRTGATRLQLYGPFRTGPGEDEVDTEEFGGGHWLWSRRTGTVSRIMLSGFQDGSSDLEPMGWSPRGNLLLVRVFSERKTSTAKHLSESLRVFDGATGRMRTLRTVRPYDTLLTRWTSDGRAVFVVGAREGEKSSLELVPLTGKAQRLFALPEGAFNLAASPDGRQLAIGNGSGYYVLSSRDGRSRRRLSKLPRLNLHASEGADEPSGDVAFSPDGRTLAVLISCASGPGHQGYWEQLWTVETKTATARREPFIGASDEGERHSLLGWVPGQAALVLCNDRKLWLQPIDPAQPSRLLVDTGPRGIDMSWWGKLPTQADRAQ